MSKGKNFSCNNVGGLRKKSDLYDTPYSITQQFLDAESYSLHKNWNILEPACGNMAIVKVLNAHGFNKVTSSDIADGNDFLKLELAENIIKYDAIITNPPYSLAYEFIKKAKELTDYIALLLPLAYLHGKSRYDNIWMDKSFPLSRIYVFTRYPMLGEPLRSDGKYHTGMMVYAWYVWERNLSTLNSTGEPIIRWLDNNSYVLNKKDE